jgi:hypothetical protein
MLASRPPKLEIFDCEALARWAEDSATGVSPLLAVALALLREL